MVDRLCEMIAYDALGFARRRTRCFSFLHARNYPGVQVCGCCSEAKRAVGYAVAGAGNGLLQVRNLVLADEMG